MNKNDQSFIAQRIRAHYIEKQATELDALRALDAEARRPANIFAYIFGSIGAIVCGAGMSLVMTEIGSYLGMESTMLPGILIGLVGLAMAALCYPLYKRILSARMRRYRDKILALSDGIINE